MSRPGWRDGAKVACSHSGVVYEVFYAAARGEREAVMARGMGRATRALSSSK